MSSKNGRRAAHLLFGTIAAISSACGPQMGEQEDFAELCGGLAPAHILPLHDHEAVAPGASVVRVDERWLYAIRTFETPLESTGELAWPPEDRTVVQIGARIESIDRCGGNRQVVAEGVDMLLPPWQDGEPWLAYRDDARELYWFDPHGRFGPLPLARTSHPAWFVVHGHTLFVHRTDHRDIVRITLEGSGHDVRTETLVTEVALTSSMRRMSGPTSIAVLRDDGSLLALDLATGATELVRDGVRVFASTLDLRWIAWAPGDPAQSSMPPPREAWLLDRRSGEEQPIAFDDSTGITAQPHEDHLVVWSENEHQIWTTRVRWLLGGHEIDLEGRWLPFGSMPDGAFVAVAPRDGMLHTFGPSDGGFVSLTEPIHATSWFDGALWAQDRTAYEHLDRPDGQRPYDILRYPHPNFEPQVVERRVHPGAAIGADRWVSVVDVSSETLLGTLQVIDGETGETRVVDHSVDLHFLGLEPHESTPPLPWRTDEIVYQVRDAGSARNGLWRARFAP